MNVYPTCLGFVHAGLGNHDEAFACFRRGLEHKNAPIVYLREDRVCGGLDCLRADPRFPALLKKIGAEAGAPVDSGSVFPVHFLATGQLTLQRFWHPRLRNSLTARITQSR